MLMSAFLHLISNTDPGLAKDPKHSAIKMAAGA